MASAMSWVAVVLFMPNLANTFVFPLVLLAERVVAEQTGLRGGCLLFERLALCHLEADVAVHRWLSSVTFVKEA